MGVVVPKPQGWCWDWGSKGRTKNTEQLKQIVLSPNPGFSILLVKWFSQVCFLTYLCMLSHFSPVWLFVMLWTVDHQSPLSMGFSRQEYCVGCHFLLQGIFPAQGSNPCLLYLLHWQGDFFTTSTKKILMTQITTMMWSLTLSQTSWSAKSSGP